MLTAADVAKSIVDNINSQITNALKTYIRSKIRVNVVVYKERLRELSGRKHIRKAFISEIVKNIELCDKTLEVMIIPEIDGICITDSISGIVKAIKVTSI